MRGTDIPIKDVSIVVAGLDSADCIRSMLLGLLRRLDEISICLHLNKI